MTLRKSGLLEWSNLRVVNLNLVTGVPAEKLIEYLQQATITGHSAVLKEKLADLYFSRGKLPEAIDSYSAALKLDPSPQQRIRVTLGLARLLSVFRREKQAIELYQQFLKDFPDYPDSGVVQQRIAALASALASEPTPTPSEEPKPTTPSPPKP